MADWRDEYKRKLVSADKCADVVRSGDRIVISLTGEPTVVLTALAKRINELKNVDLVMVLPRQDYAFFHPDMQDNIGVALENFVGLAGRGVLERHIADYYPTLFSLHAKIEEERRGESLPVDVTAVVVSAPDEQGYCYFGINVFYKEVLARSAKAVIAEVHPQMVKTRGASRIHVSDVDVFVEHDVPLAYGGVPEADEVSINLAKNICPLLRDGDTLQIGTGRASLSMPLNLLLAGKQDLGWHSEITPGHYIKRMKAGQINGARKNINHRIAITTHVQNYDKEDIAYITDNPAFVMRESSYTNHVLNIAANDNMVALNSAISVDLIGQIASETIGGNVFNGMGGQPEFAFGAILSKGGRSIHVLPSTAGDGFLSRIVPRLPEGEYVTIPRSWADYVVTEWGVAKLLGRSHRQRAEALIAVAHPKFREELMHAARKLFWP